MGLLSQTAIEPLEDLVVGGLYAPGHDGEPLAGGTCSGDPEALSECDVILEFTHPEVAPSNVSRWKSFGANVVIGTSGYGSARTARLGAEWAGSDRRCMVVPNFSLGSVLMMRCAERAAAFFAGAEIIEMHHDRKRDAPSGTAARTAELIVRARGGRPAQDAATEAFTLEGVRGGVRDGVRVHSVRLPGLVAHQEVIFGGEGQTLTIRHDSTSRESFMPGVLLAVRQVRELRGLVIGLEHLLTSSEGEA